MTSYSNFNSFYTVESIDGDNFISVDPETGDISFAKKIR